MKMIVRRQIRRAAEGAASRAVAYGVPARAESQVYGALEHRLPLARVNQLPHEIRVCVCLRVRDRTAERQDDEDAN